MSREIEAKFRVPDLVSFSRVKALRTLAGFTLMTGGSVAVKDVYQDTPARALLDAGWALRLRELSGRVLVTAKRLASASGVLHEREEIEITLESPAEPSQWPEGELRAVVLAVKRDEPLLTLFEVHQERFLRKVMQGDRDVAEMSLDQVKVLAEGREHEYLELEIELRPAGTREELLSMTAALEKELSLLPSARSKFEEGIILLDTAASRRKRRRPLRLRRSALPGDHPDERAINLEAPAGTTVEAVQAELSRLGYRFQVRSRKDENRAYFDTQSGSLFKQRVELYFETRQGRWHLLRDGAQEHEQKGAAEDLPKAGPLARSLREITPAFPGVPCLEATLQETVLAAAGISGPNLGLAIRTWLLRSPLHEAQPQTALSLALNRHGSAPFARDYLAGLLREALGLSEQKVTDLQFALTRLGVPLPGAPLPQVFLAVPGDDAAAVCGKILGAEAWRMKANTCGALRNLDPEFVHDLRVATRRARFACKLFVGVLGAETRDRIRLELSWIAGLLGGVRDLDVLRSRVQSHLERIDADRGFPPAVLSVLEERSRHARELLVPALGSERYAALLELMSAPAPGEAAEEPAEDFGRRRIGKALAKIAPWRQRNPEELTPDELHRLRILFKRLRYTAEFFRPVLGEAAALLARECVAYQDCLGLHQDARVAVRVLTGLAEEPAVREQPAGLLALGALIQVQREIMRSQREQFRTMWGSVEGLFDLWKYRAARARP
jgi:inorganic triphosphatase YgiF